MKITALFFTFAVTLRFLGYYSAFTIGFCGPSGVPNISTKSSANINPVTVSSPTVTPCFVSWTATINIMSLVYTSNRGGGRVIERHPRGRGCTHSMHSCGRKTIDPRIPTMPGRSTSGVSPTRQTLLAPSAKRREVFGESHEE